MKNHRATYTGILDMTLREIWDESRSVVYGVTGTALAVTALGLLSLWRMGVL